MKICVFEVPLCAGRVVGYVRRYFLTTTPAPQPFGISAAAAAAAAVAQEPGGREKDIHSGAGVSTGKSKVEAVCVVSAAVSAWLRKQTQHEELFVPQVVV